MIVSGKEALAFVSGKPSKQISLGDPALPASGVVPRIFLGNGVGDRFGSSAAALGDLDQDGVEDYAVGAPKEGSHGKLSGKVSVFSGGDGSVLHELFGDGEQDQLGWSVSGAGDLSGDGVPDLVAGAKEHLESIFGFGASYGSGYARVCSGADGSTLATLAGPAFGSEIGYAVAGGGDLDGDGLGDLLVGAPSLAGMAGAVFSYSFFPFQSIGWGCPGSSGEVPKLLLEGSPKPGGTLTTKIANGLGGSLAVLPVGTEPLELPLGGGCALFLVPAVAPILLAVAGDGQAKFSDDLPADLPAGPLLRIQAFVVDPAALQGFSSTSACDVKFP